MTGRPALAVSVLVACLLAGPAGCGLFGPAHGAPDPQADVIIDMGFHRFKPTDVTIHAGQIVEWRNISLVTHTITDDPALADFHADALLPPGVMPFDSGDVPAGEVFLFKFPAPGTYRYFCKHHERHGMLGTITVLPAP
ncbi:cupredoxin domain-containing protein [Hypericibacter adhaerens]|nr:plastocyanin/azurin family copper-binding protein [Hypericibacter adhaerens]